MHKKIDGGTLAVLAVFILTAAGCGHKTQSDKATSPASTDSAMEFVRSRISDQKTRVSNPIPTPLGEITFLGPKQREELLAHLRGLNAKRNQPLTEKDKSALSRGPCPAPDYVIEIVSDPNGREEREAQILFYDSLPDAAVLNIMSKAGPAGSYMLEGTRFPAFRDWVKNLAQKERPIDEKQVFVPVKAAELPQLMGKQITIHGQTCNLKLGAAVVCFDTCIVLEGDIHSWPEDQVGEQVTVTGTLGVHKGLTPAQRKRGYQGTNGDVYTLTDWSLVTQPDHSGI